MYGVVLMAALATGGSAPDLGHGGCCGYGGYGGGYGGYYGYAGCFGCYGGWGGGYGGGWGWCGGYGCSGGCWAGSPYQAWGCNGGGYGGWGCTGCYGCYGGYSCYGMPIPGGATYVGPGMTNPIPATTTPPTTPPEETPAPKKKTGTEQARAQVRIELPADAKLYVDGTLTRTGSAVRVFQTPVLSPNQTYYYDLKAEIVRDGKTYSETRQLLVRPGGMATAVFPNLEQQAAAAASTTVSQPTAQR